MQAFKIHSGVLAPLDRSNIDTDAIIPKQFLKSIHRSGFGVHLFDEWRYLDEGYSGQDCSKRPINADFVLNKPEYADASILLSRDNFGCGSSREHAPWAILQYGFRAVIASSFADIFYSNCYKNGLLPIVLSAIEVDKLFELTAMPKNNNQQNIQINIDLEQQIVYNEQYGISFKFDITEFRKYCLLNGLDEIGLSLLQQEKIKQFEMQYLNTYTWLKTGVTHG
jgi:3-isopropylmalate/(R)-2-methylmalate dehydratase small subunit